MEGHLRIYKDFQGVMGLHPLSDTMLVRHNFDAPFEVKIHEWNAWDYVPTKQDAPL
jgi:hypothetical protein